MPNNPNKQIEEFSYQITPQMGAHIILWLFGDNFAKNEYWSNDFIPVLEDAIDALKTNYGYVVIERAKEVKYKPIGVNLKVSSERIRQIEGNAYKTLRKSSQANQIRAQIERKYFCELEETGRIETLKKEIKGEEKIYNFKILSCKLCGEEQTWENPFHCAKKSDHNIIL